jgi:hypothetical protein
MKLWPASQVEGELALPGDHGRGLIACALTAPGFAMPVVVICLLAAVALQWLGGAY